MDSQLKNILSGIRQLALKEGIDNISIKTICSKLNICEDELYRYFQNEDDLVAQVLDFERNSFSSIFEEYDFEGMNAIDILMIVSREMASRYYDVTPAISIMLKEKYPDIFQAHLQKRIDFIFMKIQINLQKGISQGMYRSDLSIELIARLYMSRLVDIHNEDIFPSSQFNFTTIFEVMFDNFVRSIATAEGLRYFEEKRKSLSFDKVR